jgi:hypothetical protein
VRPLFPLLARAWFTASLKASNVSGSAGSDDRGTARKGENDAMLVKVDAMIAKIDVKTVKVENLDDAIMVNVDAVMMKVDDFVLESLI